MFEDPEDFPFTEETEQKLIKLNRGLESVLRETKKITDLNFQILEGKRDDITQEMLWYKGESAFDRVSSFTVGNSVTLAIYINKILCFNWEIYGELASCIRFAAKNLDVQVGWSSICTDLRLIDDELNPLIAIEEAIQDAGAAEVPFRFIPNHFWIP